MLAMNGRGRPQLTHRHYAPTFTLDVGQRTGIVKNLTPHPGLSHAARLLTEARTDF